MVRDGYVVYTLEVTYLSAVSGRKSVWRTYRRYSQFDDLHSCIIEQVGWRNTRNLFLYSFFIHCSAITEFYRAVRKDSDFEVAQ